MVVVEYAYEEMRKLIDLPRDEMVETLSKLGAPSEYESETKKIITELTPNRPDWYSMEGLARALKLYCKNKHPKYEAKKSKYKVVVDRSVSKIRPYTACAVVKDLRLDDERIRDMVLLQEKLCGTLGRKVKKFGIGIYPMENIAFPVKYTTMKPEDIVYRPLGFEKEVDAKTIISEHKKGQEHGHLIKDFPRYPVFVDNDGKIMCLIPVVNSHETGRVTEQTHDIFLEVTGNDLNMCMAALNILVCTFADMNGTIYEVEIDYSGKKIKMPDMTDKKRKLDVAQINKILGLELNRKEIEKLLAKMGYKCDGQNVLIPPYRADIMSWIDIAEDVAIAYGYNNFKPTMPNFFSSGDAVRRYDEIDEVMRGMGFTEIKTFLLTNKNKLGAIGYEGKLVEITNPNTQDYTVMRPNLIAETLEVFGINKMKGLPQRFYEIGETQNSEHTEKRLIFAIMDKKVDFSEFRGYLQTLAKERRFDFELVKTKINTFDSEISCEIKSDDRDRGVLGRVSKETLKFFNLEFEVFVCEIKL
ncbi:phenylalanine--tRNA ligase subunit beta [Candidatus Micrarchaeota archaeon]|nr:phenylalanine--tRNA ligase subunit beta [Candidatus Micrarchaeota archaeon]